MTKLLLLGMYMLLCVCIVQAFNVTTFMDGTSTGNLTFTGTNNVTKYLSLPLDSFLISASIFLYMTDIPAQPGLDLYGINVTTYSGYFNMITGAVINPERANDQSNTTYALVDASSVMEYYINFTNSDYWQAQNFSSKIAQGGSDILTTYCQNISSGDWINLGAQTTVDKIFPLNTYCKNGNTTNMKLTQGVTNPAYIYDMYMIGLNSTPINVSILINESTIYNNPTFLINDIINLGAGNYLQNYNLLIRPLIFLSDYPGIIYYNNIYLTYNNTLNISIYDEATNSYITDNISIIIEHLGTEISYWTTNGLLNLNNQFDGEYILTAGGGIYAQRYYTLTFTNGESQELNIYLSNSSEKTTFTVRDALTFENQESVLITGYRYIAGEYSLVVSKLTDIEGKATIQYTPDIRYFFTAYKLGYELKNWTLDPIERGEYNVLLYPEGQQGTDIDYYGVLPDIQPRLFYENDWNNVTVQLISPIHILQDYSVLLQYPGGTETQTGNNAAGETFIFNFSLSHTEINQSVAITINYITTLGNNRTYRYLYPIIQDDTNTMSYFIRNDYGMGILERLMIMIFISFLVGGIIMMLSGLETGMAVALLMQSIMAYLLNISILFVFPGILVGIIILSRRTS